MEGFSDEGDKGCALLVLDSLYYSLSSSSTVTANTLRDEVMCLSDPSITGVVPVIFTSFEETGVIPFSRADNLPCMLSRLSSISNKGSDEDLSVEAEAVDEAVEVEAGVVEGGSSGPSKESSKSRYILRFLQLVCFLCFQFLLLV